MVIARGQTTIWVCRDGADGVTFTHGLPIRITRMAIHCMTSHERLLNTSVSLTTKKSRPQARTRMTTRGVISRANKVLRVKV